MANCVIKYPEKDYSFKEINFGNTPTTYLNSGRLFIIRRGKTVILRFVDIGVRNSPSAYEVLYDDIPEALFVVSGVLVSTLATYGAQKILIDGKKIINYYSADAQRNNQSVSGELVYFAK